MGCFSRVLVGSAVIAAAAVGATWYLQGGTLSIPEAISSRLPGMRGGADSMSTAPRTALASATWQDISSAASATAQSKIEQLRERGGPSRVSLEAGELASFLVQAFARQLPSSATAAKVAVIDDMIYVKADVPLEDFGGEAILGPLAGALSRRDTIVIGGTFDLIAPEKAQFRIKEVIIGAFSVPRPLVPRLVGATRRGLIGDEYAADGYPVELPWYIADVRIARNQITLYRVDIVNEPK